MIQVKSKRAGWYSYKQSTILSEAYDLFSNIFSSFHTALLPYIDFNVPYK